MPIVIWNGTNSQTAGKLTENTDGRLVRHHGVVLTRGRNQVDEETLGRIRTTCQYLIDAGKLEIVVQAESQPKASKQGARQRREG